jgi:large subunit ribosomal protein L4
MELEIFDINGKKVDKLTLNESLWGGRANLKLLSQAIRMYRSNQRSGTASTKRRGDVSGGGKKPWRQKHTGRARVGSIRSPLWRHGGIVFGPHPRDFGYSLPKAIRRKALLESIKGKLNDKELVVLNELAASEPKTKPFSGLAKTFEVERKSVVVLEDFAEAIVKSLRNLADFELRRADDLNAFDVLNAQKLLMSKSAFQRIEQKVSSSVKSNGKKTAASVDSKSVSAKLKKAP